MSSAPVAKEGPEDFKKVGVDTAGGGEAEEKVIPVEIAIQRMAVAPQGESHLYAEVLHADGESLGAGAHVYRAQCIQCHGANGEGGLKVRNMGVWPNAYVTTQPFSSYASMSSNDAFNRVVLRGIPGELMPGNGQLSGAELRDLFTYVKGLRGK